MKPDKKLDFILIVVLVLAFLVRIVSLSADPSVFLDSGQVGDEGFWVYNARNLVLFGQTAKDDFYHDFAAAPVFSFFSLLSFSIFGVGFWQARLVSAISGFVTVIFAYKIAGAFGRKVAVLSTTFVAFNVLLLLHNRLAVGESLSIAFLTGAVYFLVRKRMLLSGALAGLCLMSKTTSFLYLPSLFLILLLGFFEKRLRNKDVFGFLISIISVILTIAIPIFLFWGRQVLQIYSAFGAWYKPQNSLELWQNILNFFTHPFWGSPFFFILVVAAIVNIINLFAEGEKNIYERKVMALWIAGVIILGPFISRISNARLLALVVPTSILASQAFIVSSKSKIDFTKISNRLKVNRLIRVLTILTFSFPAAVILTKIILAVVKRLSGNSGIVNLLPLLSLTVFPIIALFFLRFSRNYFSNLIKVFLALIIMLPIISFIDVSANVLRFFKLVQLNSTVLLSIIKLSLVSIFGTFILRRNFDFSRIRDLLLPVFFLFWMFGLATIFAQLSANVMSASRNLGAIADKEAILGFMGHELSLENRSRPIYFAPRLEHIEGVNRDFWKYEPKFLLETKIFDSMQVSDSSWPVRNDIDAQAVFVERLDLSRKFFGAERKLIIDVYRILK